MIIREQKLYKELISKMLDKLPNINQWRRSFLIETFILFMSIRERINFCILVRRKIKDTAIIKNLRSHLIFSPSTKSSLFPREAVAMPLHLILAT